jgi:uncharacterized protein (DUF58 family)
VSPTARAAIALAAVAVSAIWLPGIVVLLLALVVVALVVVDALFARRAPEVERTAPPVVARGYPARLVLAVRQGPHANVRVRQPMPPDVSLVPDEAVGGLEAEIVGRRRGRHELPAPAARVVGPLGLGAWTHSAGADGELIVYPDVPGAQRLVQALRQGRFRDEGRRTRGPLGLGTEFESVREYSPDDDVRQVNWRVTARLGRPMSNQFRIERDRDVISVIDCGRLMGAPIGDQTRLDVAVDVAVALAAVSEELGDRCGTIAFDSDLRRVVGPRRGGSRAVIESIFDLEPSSVDSDYERAFQRVGEAKRAFVVVLTDILEETAARPLLDALPVLARKHVVVVASATDADLEAVVRRMPERPIDVYRTAVTLDVLAARARVVAQLRRVADVVEAPPDALPAACVRAYLRAKSRALL